jgi:hypothetical protein
MLRNSIRPSNTPTSRLSNCTTRASASIRANTRSLADSPSWNWLQNEAMPVSGNQKRPIAWTNRYQSPGLISRAQRGVTAEIEDNGRSQPGNKHQNRKDAAKDKPLAHLHLVRLLVDVQKLIVHRLLLAEVFGNGDAADRLLHLGVDGGQQPLRLLGGGPGNAAEGQRRAHHKRGNRQGHPGQLGVDRKEVAHDEHHQQHLADQVQRQGDDVGKSCVSDVTRLTILPEGNSS